MPLPSPFEPIDLADIGIFGGSGFYTLLEGTGRQISVQTPYGSPSDVMTLGTIGDTRVAFLPRHGAQHTFPPHRVNYRANLWAMAQLGVTRIVAPSAVGSLKLSIEPGHFVLCDQFVDRTSGRTQTFFDGPRVVHVSTADPYCSELRPLAGESARALGIPVYETGTVVVIEGPRFSTRAESRWFSSQGWDVVNMTQFPEVVLARELEMCYLNISLVTDYDTGLEGNPDLPAVSVGDVLQVMASNTHHVRALIAELLPRIPHERSCSCGQALTQAVVS